MRVKWAGPSVGFFLPRLSLGAVKVALYRHEEFDGNIFEFTRCFIVMKQRDCHPCDPGVVLLDQAITKASQIGIFETNRLAF
jgi:hypothetical protein